MTDRSIKNYHWLKVLHDSKPTTRKALLAAANKELIDTICECLKNILLGRIKISQQLLKKLKRRRRAVEEIQSKKTNIKRKKELLIQQGGFLPAIIAPLLGIAASLIGGLIK